MIADRVMLWATAVLLALSTTCAVVQTVRIAAAHRTAAELRQVVAQDRQGAAEQALQASEAARLEERRRSVALKEIENHAEAQAARIRTDVDRARSAGLGLRVRAEAVAEGNAGAASGDPNAAGNGTAASGGSAVLADLLGRAVEEAVELARIADERGAAGAACERAHDAMTPD